ncbi:Hypothetical_protein [Hexamita inflata]|uniref:Hypothetical_protein n=1 Tax=Hexamita inflata TaxID=28002 RepID=A0AA86U627_9EUKA|nr:Hypothetical protein HINF_LOCUS30014 [Hexamita inflata]
MTLSPRYSIKNRVKNWCQTKQYHQKLKYFSVLHSFQQFWNKIKFVNMFIGLEFLEIFNSDLGQRLYTHHQSEALIQCNKQPILQEQMPIDHMNITHKLSCVINLKIYTKQRLLNFLSSYILIVITIKKSPPRNSKVVHQFKICEKYRFSEQDTPIILLLKPNENYLIMVHLHLKGKRLDCHCQLKYQNE